MKKILTGLAALTVGLFTLVPSHVTIQEKNVKAIYSVTYVGNVDSDRYAEMLRICVNPTEGKVDIEVQNDLDKMYLGKKSSFLPNTEGSKINTLYIKNINDIIFETRLEKFFMIIDSGQGNDQKLKGYHFLDDGTCEELEEK